MTPSAVDYPLAVDNTVLQAIAKCSTYAYVTYILGYRTVEERAPLKAGIATHSALDRFFRGASAKTALAVFESEYREWAEANVKNDDRLSWFNLEKIMRYWFDTHKVIDMPFGVQPEKVEVTFEYPLDDNGEFISRGRIDAVVRDISHHDSDRFLPCENKTTGSYLNNSNWRDKFTTDSQLSNYVWATEQYVGSKVTGGYINAIRFGKLPADPNRKCGTHKVAYSECSDLHNQFEIIGPINRSPQELVEWRKTAIFLAKKFKDLKQRFNKIEDIPKVRTPGKFTGQCANCELKNFCDVGRPLNVFGGPRPILVHDPWEPGIGNAEMAERKQRLDADKAATK